MQEEQAPPKEKEEVENPKNQQIEPYKTEEFEKFLDMLRGEAVYHWQQIADSLGVHRDTITAWKNHKSARKAIRDGIEKSLDGMTKAGKDDWRMWESKLKMLGVSPIERQDVTSGGEKINGFNYQPPVKDDSDSKTDNQTA